MLDEKGGEKGVGNKKVTRTGETRKMARKCLGNQRTTKKEKNKTEGGKRGFSLAGRQELKKKVQQL